MTNDLICPKCGNNKIVKSGLAIRKGGKTQSYRCNDCGHVFIEKKSGETK